MPPLHILRLSQSPRTTRSVFRRLLIDECIFRDVQQRSWMVIENVPTLATTTTPNDISIILGLSGKLTELVYEDRVRNDNNNVSILRRFTGGGTVALDSHSQLISITTSQPVCKPYPKEVMQFTMDSLYKPAFQIASNGQCIGLQLLENDYTINNLKIGGNAQALILNPGRFLHHTSLLWEVNERTMSFLKMPNKRPAYRIDRSHGEFLTGLNQACPLLDSTRFVDVVIDCYAEALNATNIVIHENDSELLAESASIVENTRNVILFNPS
jgi:lipoate-protein ligase A